MSQAVHKSPLPPEIARAIQIAEEQIEFLHRLGTMQPGDQHQLTVGGLRPITSILGLEPQSEYLRSDMPLTLIRTTDGWRVG